MWLSLSLLAAPWLLFFWQLSSEFAQNPTYQFALLAPLIIGYLALLRAEISPAPLKGRLLSFLLLAGFILLLPLRLLFEANADWRLIQWLQGLLSAGLTSLLLLRWGGKAYLKHYLPLVLLPLLCIPWPTGLEKSVGTALMSGIASASVEIVHLLGMEAHRAGNIIFLTNGATVGVEEACAGLRSLAGNIFAAGVLGELFALTLGQRGFLFVASILFALLFNFLRSLILVVTAATSGAQWTLLLHDTAGWSIFVVSFLALYGLGKFLSTPAQEAASEAPQAPALPRWLVFTGLFLVVVSEPLVSLYYPAAPAHSQVTLNSPAAIGLANDVKTADATRFRALLFYTQGESWRWRDDSGDWQLFFFHWSDPRLSRLGGAYHRPERCLPNTGWKLLGAPQEIQLTLKDGTRLPATLTQFTDLSGRQATLLFAHWGDNLADIGLDTRLDPAERWEDFLHHRRLASRTALQLSVIGNNENIPTELVEKAQTVLTATSAF